MTIISTAWEWLKTNPKTLLIVALAIFNLVQVSWIVVTRPSGKVSVVGDLPIQVDIKKYRTFQECVTDLTPESVYQTCSPKAGNKK